MTHRKHANPSFHVFSRPAREHVMSGALRQAEPTPGVTVTGRGRMLASPRAAVTIGRPGDRVVAYRSTAC